MFSPNAHEYSKLIETSFIAGISQENIKGISYNYVAFINSRESILLKPEYLIGFPHNNEFISSILEVYLIFIYLVCFPEWCCFCLFRRNT